MIDLVPIAAHQIDFAWRDGADCLSKACDTSGGEITEKFCNGCSSRKHVDEFYKSKSKRDGYESRCKKCSQDAGRQKYLKNKEEVNSRSIARQKANPEKHRDSVRQWRDRNQDLVRERDKLWRQMNPEKVRLKAHRRRAQKKNVGGKISVGLAQKLLLLQRGKCACCGLPLGDDFHMDHIMPMALGGPNTDDNIQLLRQRCNSQKSSKHPVDFMQQRGRLL